MRTGSTRVISKTICVAATFACGCNAAVDGITYSVVPRGTCIHRAVVCRIARVGCAVDCVLHSCAQGALGVVFTARFCRVLSSLAMATWSANIHVAIGSFVVAWPTMAHATVARVAADVARVVRGVLNCCAHVAQVCMPTTVFEEAG